jgi:hypothetical protein
MNVSIGKIEISYKCENCGTEDYYIQVLDGSYNDRRGSYSGPQFAIQNKLRVIEKLNKKKNNIFESYDGINVRKCPHCNRYQSWMHNSLLDKNINLGIVILLAMVYVSLLIISSLRTRFEWGYAMALGLVFYIFGAMSWTIMRTIASKIRFIKELKKSASKLKLKEPPTLKWLAD